MIFNHMPLLCSKGDSMVKVWKDVDEVVKMIHDLEDKKLRELDKEMKIKPKFEKCENKEEKYHKK